MNNSIEVAKKEDLPEILQLQHKTFSQVADIMNNRGIPALLMDEKGIEAEYLLNTILKYTDKGKIIASVRGNISNDFVCYIGTLVVAPEHQGKGIARALMGAIEKHFSQCKIYILFTNPITPHTVQLYKNLGYNEAYRKPINNIEMIFMEKNNENK